VAIDVWVKNRIPLRGAVSRARAQGPCILRRYLFPHGRKRRSDLGRWEICEERRWRGASLLCHGQKDGPHQEGRSDRKLHPIHHRTLTYFTHSCNKGPLGEVFLTRPRHSKSTGVVGSERAGQGAFKFGIKKRKENPVHPHSRRILKRIIED